LFRRSELSEERKASTQPFSPTKIARLWRAYIEACSSLNDIKPISVAGLTTRHDIQMSVDSDSQQSRSIQDEINDLEGRLRSAKARLNSIATGGYDSTQVPRVLAAGGNDR
jgi:hypothetical protein